MGKVEQYSTGINFCYLRTTSIAVRLNCTAAFSNKNISDYGQLCKEVDC